MEYSELCKAVEDMVGRKMQTASDFEWLSNHMSQRMHEHLSTSTLKRVWGYFGQVKTRSTTVDVLSRFIGYKNYEAFLNRSNNTQSSFTLSRHITSESLEVGDKLCIKWQPDRSCVIEHLGEGKFRILSAINTKLSVGDTFYCQVFIENEPLFIDKLIHRGSPPVGYIAGRKNGIIIERINRN